MSFGRLERTPASPPMSDINMTPLIDVMLVLLVIFIITAPLMTSAVKVDLPTAEGGQALPAPKFVAIAMDKHGQVFLDDKPVALDALAVALQAAAQRSPMRSINRRGMPGAGASSITF